MADVRDVRAKLEALAAGKGETPKGVALINEAIASDRQVDFQAWLRFTRPRDGEPLSAPAELLTPLP